jgi:hypothetical protein
LSQAYNENVLDGTPGAPIGLQTDFIGNGGTDAIYLYISNHNNFSGVSKVVAPGRAKYSKNKYLFILTFLYTLIMFTSNNGDKYHQIEFLA